MESINIIIIINIIATFGANFSGARKSLSKNVTQQKEKPKTYLQTLPPLLSTIALIALLLGLFQIGTLKYDQQNQTIRIIGLIFYLIFSWIQIWAYKSLGDNYSQDVIILKNHKLIIKGPYKIIRHPHYLSQIIVDLSAAIAVMSYIVLVIAIIEIPFLIMRAKLEDKLLQKYFKDEFNSYKKKSGLLIPFVG